MPFTGKNRRQIRSAAAGYVFCSHQKKPAPPGTGLFPARKDRLPLGKFPQIRDRSADLCFHSRRLCRTFTGLPIKSSCTAFTFLIASVFQLRLSLYFRSSVLSMSLFLVFPAAIGYNGSKTLPTILQEDFHET